MEGVSSYRLLPFLTVFYCFPFSMTHCKIMMNTRGFQQNFEAKAQILTKLCRETDKVVIKVVCYKVSRLNKIFSSAFALWAKLELYLLVSSLTPSLTHLFTHLLTPGVENSLKGNLNSLLHLSTFFRSVLDMSRQCLDLSGLCVEHDSICQNHVSETFPECLVQCLQIPRHTPTMFKIF